MKGREKLAHLLFDKCVRSRSGRIKKKMGRGFEGGIMQLGKSSNSVGSIDW